MVLAHVNINEGLIMKRVLFISAILVAYSGSASAVTSQEALLMQMQNDYAKMIEEQAHLLGKFEDLQRRIYKLEQAAGQVNYDSSGASDNMMAPGYQNNTMTHGGNMKDGQQQQLRPEYPEAPKNLDNRMAIEVYSKAQQLMQYGDLEGARKEFRSFVQNFSNDPLVVNARYWLAETYFSVQDYKNASTEYGEAYQAYQVHKKDAQTDSKAPEILLKLAMSLKNMGQTKEAMVTLNQFEKEFSWAPATYKEQAKMLRSELG